MSANDRILLHPDALHCLKRKQLVSLCRRLDIKASGKNSDLIYRLQTFAANNITLDSPTKGNLALLKHVKRPRPSFQEAKSDDEEEGDSDNDNRPTASGSGEMTLAELEEATPSLLRSPRKRNMQLHDEEVRPLRRSTREPRQLTESPSEEVSRAAHAKVAELSESIDEMIRDMKNKPQNPDLSVKHELEEQEDTPMDQDIPETKQELADPSTAEFGSMAAMTALISDSTSVRSSSSKKSTASTSSSPWKVLSGSLKGLKNGLQRMGSLSKPKKVVGGKRTREIKDVGTKDDTEEVGDHSMPGSFVFVESELSQTEAEQKSPESAAIQSLRIIKPRPSRSMVSHMNNLTKSPSGLYPDLSTFNPSSLTASFAPLTSAPSITSQQFSAAAASVLAEMNARLAAAGKSTSSISTLGNSGWNASTTSLRDLGLSKGKSFRFDVDHQKQFNKMDSIANHYAAKRMTASTSRPAELSSSVAKTPSRINAATSTNLVAFAARPPQGMSRLPPSKRIKTSTITSAPSTGARVTASTSTRSLAPPTVIRSPTTTSLSTTAQRELQRKRLELARQRRKSKSGPAPTAGRMDRIKNGIRDMLNPPSKPALTVEAAKKKPVFDIKASLSRNPSGYTPYNAKESHSVLKGAEAGTKATIASRVRTQGWTGEAAKPVRREFGSVRTNTLPLTTSTNSISSEAAKKTLLKAGKPPIGSKRPRADPERTLQCKKEAIVKASTITQKISTRAPATPSRAEAMRAARLNELRARQRALEAGIGGQPELTPRSSSLKNLRRLMRKQAPSKLGMGGGSPVKTSDEEMLESKGRGQRGIRLIIQPTEPLAV